MGETIRKPDFELLKRRIAEAGTALRQLAEIEAEKIAADTELHEAITAMEDRFIKKSLAGMGLEVLSGEKMGIRIAALRSAGIENLSQLYGRTLSGIQRISGIGEQNAALIYSMVNSAADMARSRARLTLSLDDRSAEQSRLLTALYRFRAGRDVADAALALIDLNREALLSALEDAERVRSGFLWLFASKTDRAAVAAAAETLNIFSGRGIFSETAELYRRFCALPEASLKTARADLAANAGSYAVTLDEVRGVAASSDRLPQELADSVAGRVLHLEHLNATLRRYQEFGVKYVLNQKFSLLGDEMGLGKTVQAIAAMASLKAEGGKKFLVVCPASVLVNWLREIGQFSDISVTEIHGSDKGEELRAWINEGEAAVTTYETAKGLVLPEGFRVSMLVADEAHYVKNPGAQRTQAVRSLSRRADHVLYMTGTPIENNVDEMCALIDGLQPETAEKARQFTSFYQEEEFRAAVAPVYLRRSREDVLTELPEKTETEQWCRPTKEDSSAYNAAVIDGNFMAMRRVSWQHGRMDKSAKAQRLLEILQMARDGNRKVIVFTFFLDTAKKVCKIAGESCFGPINGSVPAAKRQQIVDEFAAAPDGAVLVSQIAAGGTGLNIQAASVVVFCEPQIKPSIEDQALSRCYRMGQTRNVLVYRLLCEGTVDEDMQLMLSEKREIIEKFGAVSEAAKKADEAMNRREWQEEIIQKYLDRIQEI